MELRKQSWNEMNLKFQTEFKFQQEYWQSYDDILHDLKCSEQGPTLEELEFYEIIIAKVFGQVSQDPQDSIKNELES